MWPIITEFGMKVPCTMAKLRMCIGFQQISKGKVSYPDDHHRKIQMVFTPKLVLNYFFEIDNVICINLSTLLL